MAEHVDKQYAPGANVFGFPLPESTGAQGSSPSEGTPPATLQHGQLGSGLPVGHTENSTGAPGGPGATPPADGGSVDATDFYGQLGSSQAPPVHGTANTSKSALTDPFVKPGSGFGGGKFSATSTGAGEGHAATERP